MDGEASPRRSPEPVEPPAVHAESSKSASPRRPDADGEDANAPPTKRARPTRDRKAEDTTRSRRMFGNLLGTLQKFKDDDGKSRGSEAAKRREQTSARIAERLRSETTKQHAIAETERELKALKVAGESAVYVLKHKEIALEAQHSAMRTAARYLHTTADNRTPLFEVLIPAASLPLARGPGRGDKGLKALYFLPKVLLPHQEERLRAQAADADTAAADAGAALRTEKEEARAAAAANRERIAELGDKLHELKGKRGDDSSAPPREEPRDRERERERDEVFEVDVTAHGDEMEVEY
ncbi:uncharacterized protein LOC62_06G007986 [Vanrija pseudolonga]|uniref:Pinin/SDK/MemA protein domain-containing protein n=1 Tax=Vanrija pseudolonga TaxID=143232 RepID=A0AAF0YEL1_9TREE|nr:hypothetical protein LOC62_06G007986 [Vanrija pseudolonga]